jgi:signal peptidase I
MAQVSETGVVNAYDQEGLKETLESLVVALILAFVFRAFIVEAFVIPTGSMAPTLYGAHGTIVCEDCGMEFAYGVRDLSDPRRASRVRTDSRALCPNCNHANTQLKINDERRNRERGDRILVLKWPLDLGADWFQPARWDVTVFKDPADGTTNFIKRLIGLPHEVLTIIDGDVYTVPVEEISAEAREALEGIVLAKHELYEKERGGRLSAVPQSVLDELDGKLNIARKTSAAQMALWTTVYDHDFPPRTLGTDQPRWVAEHQSSSGWDVSSRRIRFADRNLVDDYITMAGKEIDARCAYNIQRSRAHAVADMRLSFVVTPHAGSGTIHLRLEKHGRVFWASLSMNGTVTLRESNEPPVASDVAMASTTLEPFVPGKSYEIAFENVDYRLALSVGRNEVWSSSKAPESPAFYAPDLGKLRRYRITNAPPPRIYGSGGDFEISHLVIERDIYYYHDPSHRALSLPWAPRSGWASPEGPILLRDGEYFMLGDNTTASKDSRLWDVRGPHLKARGARFQLGTVPRDQLIGKAFYVYWPSGLPIQWLPRIGSWNWTVVPDVGRMRWIR